MACGWGAPPRPAGGCEYAKDATPSSAANIRTFLLRIALLSYPKPPNHQTVLSSQSRQATVDERTKSSARGSLVDVISFKHVLIPLSPLYCALPSTGGAGCPKRGYHHRRSRRLLCRRRPACGERPDWLPEWRRHRW